MAILRFKNSARIELVGVLETPAGDGPFPAVVFAHGWDSGKDSPRTVPLASRLVAEGVAALRMDLTGHGESGGTRDESTAERQTDDVVSALETLASNPRIDRRAFGLHGASSGAIAAVRAAAGYPGVRAIVLRGPRTDYLRTIAAQITAPLLIIQGAEDPLLAESRSFIDSLSGERELVVIEGAGHLFDRTPRQFEESIRLTVSWFKRWLLG